MTEKVARKMKDTWDILARADAMRFIATERDDWDIKSFLASGNEIIRDVLRLDEVQWEQKTGVILDLGCGIGRLSFALAELPARVIAVDVSEEMIRQANLLKRELGYSNVDFYRNNGHDLSFVSSNSCDLAISYVVLQHIPDTGIVLGYIRELARVVRPGGHVVFQVPIYQKTLLVYPWRFFQFLFRCLLWRVEDLGLVPPQKGIAFRGSRLLMKELKYTICESNLELLAIRRRPCCPYRFCDCTIVYCRKSNEL